MQRHLVYLGRGLFLITILLIAPFLINTNWGVFLLVLYLLPAVLLVGSGLGLASIIVVLTQTLGLAYIIGRQKPFILKAALFSIIFYTVEITVGILLIGIGAASAGL